MSRVILLLLATVALASASTLNLDHALLTGDFRFGEALTGLFHSTQSVEQDLERYLKSVHGTTSLDGLFAEFKAKYNKKYASAEEESTRRALFAQRLVMVIENNVRAMHHLSGHSLAISAISDLTLEETLLQPAGNWPSTTHLFKPENISESVYADSWIFDNYRQHHQVSSIQNQGSCGACVYFAAAACIESYWARQGHQIEVLSPQQLNDCAHDEQHGNRGCQHGGGTFVPTFNYIKAHGLTSMNNYPYLAHDAECDRNKERQAVAHIRSWHPIVPHSNDVVLQQSIEQHGPAAVALHVSDSWAHYRSGIYAGDCKGGRNHAVLAVGFGYDAGSNQNYWIVKNQWGEGFGEHGFIRIRKDHGDGFNNWCDIAGDAVAVE